MPDRPSNVSDEPAPKDDVYAEMARQRHNACHELLEAARWWLGPVPSPQDRPWLEQRQMELIVRAIQTMKGVVILSESGLWAQASALARMLLEDVAVAYWLVDHPDVGALQTRWSEHRDAALLGDVKAQEALGLVVDDRAAAWHISQDPEYLARISRRYRDGTNHWTGKSLAELIAGLSSRAEPDRVDWSRRLGLLDAGQKRMSRIASLGLHHSPTASQHWYAHPARLLLDPLRISWVAFWLHVQLAVESFAPGHASALSDLVNRQGPVFSAGDDDPA